MNWESLRRWTMRSIHAAVLGAALLSTGSAVLAQSPGVVAAKLPKQNFTRSMQFDLPVVMDQEFRTGLSEIRLYVKTPTTGWKLQSSDPPHTTRFSCKVAQDGEYWYTLATVDRLGRMTPVDVNLEPPSQRVVVDTTAPVLSVAPTTSPEGDLCLRCTAQDANLDPTSLRAVCKTEFGDIPLEEVPSQPGIFRIKGTEPLRFPVVVSARDLAGNIGVKEINVKEMIGSTLNPQTPPKTDIKQAQGTPDAKDPQLPPPRFDPPAPKVDPPGKIENPPHRTELPPPMLPMINNPALPDPIKLPQPPATTADAAPKSTVPHQLINTTRAMLDYRIDHVGPSGVGKVEIYMTPDNGQSWHRLGEDADKRSPAEITLPGDGVFGIRVVVTNGNGFGGKAPVRGDTPHCTLEFDTTAPFVQLRSAEILPASGQVELRWLATDNNLGSEPVSLFFRTRPDGPWQVIARNVKNEGSYRWTPPRDAGAQMYFKIEVADRANNVSQDSSRQPVVIDVSEPRATVVGVSGNSRQN